jgi:calcium-dependent protein kinase
MHVAIKVLDKDQMKYDIELLKEEVAVLNKLDHPNIVKYYETYNDYKFIYLVMEYVKGKELFKYLAQQTDHSEKRTCGYMQDIVSAIAHCHAQQVIHRDIKPENIMVDRKG